MTLVPFAAITLMLLVTFGVMPKTLDMYRLIFVWIAVVLINDSVHLFISDHFQYAILSDSEGSMWMYMIHLHIVTPLIITWTMDYMFYVKGMAARWVGFFAGLLVLFYIEQHFKRIGLFHYNEHWNFIFAAIEIWFLLAASYVLLHLYTFIMRRDGLNP